MTGIYYWNNLVYILLSYFLCLQRVIFGVSARELSVQRFLFYKADH